MVLQKKKKKNFSPSLSQTEPDLCVEEWWNNIASRHKCSASEGPGDQHKFDQVPPFPKTRKSTINLKKVRRITLLAE